MSSRRMSLLPRATLHSDSEHLCTVQIELHLQLPSFLMSNMFLPRGQMFDHYSKCIQTLESAQQAKQQKVIYNRHRNITKWDSKIILQLQYCTPGDINLGDKISRKNI